MVPVLLISAAIAVLATGFARAWWGVKGTSWYFHQPLLHLKLALFIVIGLLSIKPTLMFLRWRRKLDVDGQLPADVEIREARRWVLVEAYLPVLVPLAATLLARGVGTR